MTIFTPVGVADTQASRTLMLVRAQRGALAALQLEPRAAALPLAAGLSDEDTLRCDDAPERRLGDSDASARDDLTFDLALAKGLLVLVPLVVTIEEPAHWRVAPIYDAHACASI